jgi:NADPH-dependent curcumin reductase CurA
MSREVILASRPSGALRASDLEVRDQALPVCGDGELRLAITYLSIDPFTRIFLDEHALGGALPGAPIGSVLPGAAIARVEESRAPGYARGDFVEGRFGWREAFVTGTAGIRKIEPELGATAAALGILGLPGLTAYTGIVGVIGIAEGETVIISSAAGSVGLIAGQIARRLGARTVGIAGGPAKCALVRDHGFDACVDYKAPDFEQALVAACPTGAQAYLDNVGGRVAMAAYAALGRGGRVALCGLLSLYQEEAGTPGDLGRFMRLIMSKGLSIQAYSTVQSCPPDALKDLSTWMGEGAIRLPQTTIDGLEKAPAAFVDLLEGRIRGKLVIRVADPSPG